METSILKYSLQTLRIIISLVFVSTSSICMADSFINRASTISVVQLNGSQQEATYRNKASRNSCNAYFNGSQSFVHECRLGEVPPQVAIWLFLLSIVGFTGFLNRKKL